MSARTVATMKRPGLHADGGGLYLQVTIGADRKPRRSWIVRYTAPDGRRREMGLGDAALIDLASARAAALEAPSQVGNRSGQAAEAALAHAVGNQVEAAHRRGDLFDKRRRLMEAWAEYCQPAKHERPELGA